MQLEAERANQTWCKVVNSQSGSHSYPSSTGRSQGHPSFTKLCFSYHPQIVSATGKQVFKRLALVLLEYALIQTTTVGFKVQFPRIHMKVSLNCGICNLRAERMEIRVSSELSSQTVSLSQWTLGLVILDEGGIWLRKKLMNTNFRCLHTCAPTHTYVSMYKMYTTHIKEQPCGFFSFTSTLEAFDVKI